MAELPDEAPIRTLYLGTPVAGYPALAPEAARGTVRPITVVGEGVLRRKCAPVHQRDLGTEALATLIDDLFLMMYAARGVGLAANQIGVGLRVFVYDCLDDAGTRHVGHLVNPVVDRPGRDGTLDRGGEGCLSVPGPVREVVRPATARARGVDRDGVPVVLDGTGYFARCLQHETDHLDGRLYIDQLSRRERAEVLDEMASMREDVAARQAARLDQLHALFHGRAAAPAGSASGPGEDAGSPGPQPIDRTD